MVSYRTVFLTMTTTSGILEVELPTAGYKMIYLALSIIVITQDNSYVELLAFETDYSTLNQATLELSRNSAKFNFSSGTPFINHFLEWISRSKVSNSSSPIPVKTYTNLSITAPNTVSINFLGSSNFIRVKVNALLVSRQIGNNITIEHTNKSVSTHGLLYSFTFNFGIRLEAFGSWWTGSCFIGIDNMYSQLPYFYNQTVWFLFAYSWPYVSAIPNSGEGIINLNPVCYGQCPSSDPLFNSTHCVNCQTAIPYCANCITAFSCAACMPGGFVLAVDTASCPCPVRTVVNTTA